MTRNQWRRRNVHAARQLVAQGFAEDTARELAKAWRPGALTVRVSTAWPGAIAREQTLGFIKAVSVCRSKMVWHMLDRYVCVDVVELSSRLNSLIYNEARYARDAELRNRTVWG